MRYTALIGKRDQFIDKVKSDPERYGQLNGMTGRTTSGFIWVDPDNTEYIRGLVLEGFTLLPGNKIDSENLLNLQMATILSK